MWPSTSLLVLWAACQGGEEDTGLTCDEGEVAAADRCLPMACGTGRWGDLRLDDRTVFVHASAPEGGDGTQDAPLRDLGEALDLADDEERPHVVLGEGTYVGSWILDGHPTDLVLEGRCSDLVSLTHDGSVDSTVLILDYVGAGSGSWTLRNLTVAAKDYGIAVLDGTALFQEVVVEGAWDSALFMEGEDTAAHWQSGAARSDPESTVDSTIAVTRGATLALVDVDVTGARIGLQPGAARWRSPADTSSRCTTPPCTPPQRLTWTWWTSRPTACAEHC